ncbi:MAG TPA: oxidoreductase C-terminal domain-containing protein, partial [Steroidobacteraceae bacterium]|nr:oxidoreductase C-terminal domain-containing protein [Steroidobacteraceae bacterium]
RGGDLIRLESVQNAIDQAKHAALAMVGKPTAYREVPWFWSDQYDLKLIIIGMSHGYDAVVMRGDPATHAFSACYLRGGELIAVDAVNSPKDQMAARKLIAARARPSIDKLADPGVPMKDTA